MFALTMHKGWKINHLFARKDTCGGTRGISSRRTRGEDLQARKRPYVVLSRLQGPSMAKLIIIFKTLDFFSYVDDLLVTDTNEKLIIEFKAKMFQVFEMIDLGLMSFFLGEGEMEVKQDCNSLYMPKEVCKRDSQKSFACKIAKVLPLQ
ncbi:hypothetical protein CR513_07755, partial [Mucuna pruriens]